MIDDFFLSLEGKKKNKTKAEQIKIDSLGSALYHLYVSGKLDTNGLDGLDGWKDDKEKFKIDLLNDIKTFLFSKWEKPWNVAITVDSKNSIIGGFRNINGRDYTNQSNIISLKANSGESPFFATLAHVRKNGGKITDGKKVTSVISFIPIREEQGGKIKFMLPRFHNVINVDFVEGIKKPKYKIEEFKEFELNEYVENFINILKALGRIPKLHYDQTDKAYYTHKLSSWDGDSIHLVPIKNFKGINQYYSTLFHEIIHSTMNPNRCGRGKTKGETTKLEYANEELVAEMGAMIVCSELGLEYNRQNSITYLKGWLTDTKEAKNGDVDTALIESYAYACDAAEYLMKNINFEKLMPKSMKKRLDEEEKPEPTPDKPTKRTKKAEKAKEKGKKNSPVTPPSEPGKSPFVGKQQGKSNDTVVKSQFYYAEDTHNLSKFDKEWVNTGDYLVLKKEMGEIAPRMMMAVTGVPMNYPKKHKLYFGDVTGNINIKPLPTKVGKAKDMFNVALSVAGKDELRPVQMGVYMDAENGCMVATDSHILIKIPHPIEGKSRTLNKYKQPIEGVFPNYTAVISSRSDYEKEIDLQALLNEAAGVAELKKLTDTRPLLLTIGTPFAVISFDAERLTKLLKAMIMAGCKSAKYGHTDSTRIVTFKDSTTGVIGLLMPINHSTIFSKHILLTENSKIHDYSGTGINGTTEPEQPVLFGTDKKDYKVSLSGIDDINTQFNNELEQLMNGELKQNHVFYLGDMSDVLSEIGLPLLPIEMQAQRLFRKSKQSNHVFELSALKNLPLCLNNPIMVFKSKTKDGSIVVLTELEANNHNFVAAIEINKTLTKWNKGEVKINDVRSIYPKDTITDVLNWIEKDGLLQWVEKKKSLNLLVRWRSNYAKATQQIKRCTNIIQNFENSKSINGTTEPKTPLKDFGLSKLGSQKKNETYKLSGDLGDFLGEYDRLHYSIVLRGEKGAGKSRLLFQLINAFAAEQLKTAFLSLEMHPGSSVMTRYAEEYISPANLNNIDVTDTSLTYDELNQLCKMYDVVAIDSWTKLKGMEQTDFDRLQKDNPATIIIAIFQSTTGKVTRGGNMPEYDAGTVIQVNKGGLAECEKNRYTATDKIYSVFDKCLVEIEEEDK